MGRLFGETFPMRLPLAACAAILLALAACGKKDEAKTPEAAPAPAVAAISGFAHDPAFDAAGFYRPAPDIVIGKHRLSTIAIGAPSDFAQWEAGDREGLFGPILVEFDDITSPTETNEMGAVVHTVRIRVLPTAYQLTSGKIAFKGSDPAIGAIVIDGVFDPAAFKAGRETGSSGNTPVLSATVQIGQEAIRDRRFTFWAGD